MMFYAVKVKSLQRKTTDCLGSSSSAELLGSGSSYGPLVPPSPLPVPL